MSESAPALAHWLSCALVIPETPIAPIEMFNAHLFFDPRLSAKDRRKRSYEIMAAALARLERKDA